MKQSGLDTLEIPKLSSSRPRWVIGGIVLVLLLAGLITYLLTRPPPQSPYLTATVSKADIVKEIRVTGHLQPTAEFAVPAPIEGQLVHIAVRSGDAVEEGQTLAQLDWGPAKLAVDIANAEAGVRSARVSEAEASYQRATESLERTTRLAAKSLASQSRLESAQADVTKARAALKAAKAELAAARTRASAREQDRARTDVLAPRAGLILEAPKHTGLIVSPEQTLFRIATALDEMHIEAPIGESDIGDVAVGQKAQFEVPAYPGRLFEASVIHISPDPHIDAGAVFYFVTLAASNPDSVLFPGMTAQVRIRVTQVREVLAVREAALRFTPAGAPSAPPRSRVWRVRGMEIEPVDVEVGLSDGAMTQIRSIPADALQTGDRVAVGISGSAESDAIAPGLSLRGQK